MFRLKTPVKQVIVENNRATGVTLESGESLTADIVCVNADLVYAYNNLLPKTSYIDSLAKRQSSCSSISFYWSLDRVVPKLGTHNIFLAQDYARSFDEIFDKHTMPEEPSFYVNVPSRIDPSAAPPGRDTVVILVPVGHLTADNTRDESKTVVARARRQVLETLSARLGLKDFGDYIVDETVNDPFDWKDEFNLDRGVRSTLFIFTPKLTILYAVYLRPEPLLLVSACANM